MKSGFLSERDRCTIISPQIFADVPGLCTGMSTKLGGDATARRGLNLSYKVGDDPSEVKKNRDAFFASLGILENELAVPLQCHSNAVMRADRPGEYSDCDALITNEKHVALAVVVADCVPLLLFDPVHCALGAVHAGWRGTAGSIIARTVERMKSEYQTDPVCLKAFIGPSAGPCCYEVGKEVAVMFGNKVVPCDAQKIFLDLKEENKERLQEQGVAAQNIEMSALCTICEKHLLHSFRRDGSSSGRMMAVICLK